MVTLTTDVLVIGGDATGAGVAWDVALRRFDVALADRADLATGTSGRVHGLLHSGGHWIFQGLLGVGHLPYMKSRSRSLRSRTSRSTPPSSAAMTRQTESDQSRARR